MVLSSSQNELGRGQSDKQRGVGVREAKPEGFAGEQRCSRCMESRVQVRNGRRQPVPRGEVVVDAAARSTRTAKRWGLEEPLQLKTGGSTRAFLNGSEALRSFGGGKQTTAREETINPICRGGWD